MPPARTPSAQRCGLALSEWGVGVPRLGAPVDPVLNRLEIERTGTLLWNRSAISADALRQYLQITATMSPRPVFLLEADPAAPCDRVREAVGIADSVLDCTARQCVFRWTEVR